MKREPILYPSILSDRQLTLGPVKHAVTLILMILVSFTTQAIVDGGTVTSNLGDTIAICAGDGVSDSFSMSTTSASPDSYIYVITSPATEVLGVSTNGIIDLEGAGDGECWVWGLSYTGNLLIGLGDTVTTFGPPSDSTSDLSSNFVVVERTGVDAGVVSSNMGDTIRICAGDGMPDPFVMSNTSTATASYAYIITDPQTVVLGTSISPTIDLEGAGAGICLVWGVSFTGMGLFGIGDTIATFGALSDGCAHLSSNYIVVERTQANAGILSSDMGTTVNICVGDGTPDPVTISNNSTSTENYMYFITSTATEILAMQTDSVVDLEGAGQGTCYVVGFSYSGNVLIGLGDTISTFGPLTDECFDLSNNFITINRDYVEGGSVTSNLGDTLRICAGDGMPDPFTMDTSGTADGATYAYIITDPQTVVLGTNLSGNLDFDGNGPGECWVWGVSYTGSGLFGIGDTIATFGALSTECFDLSDNYVVVLRSTPDGATVSSNLGDSLDICAGDGVADPFIMNNTSTSASAYGYVVTSPATEVLAISTDSTFDFESAGGGQCWVWGISYSGNILIGVGDTVATFGALTDECYELSSNYVVVTRTGVEGGTVTSDLGDTLIVCAGDGAADPFVMSTTGDSTQNYAYVITDPNTMVLAIDPVGMLDLDGAGPGECWVWGLSYTGNVLVNVGDTVSTFGALTDGCFDLSDNYVVALRFTPEGGVVTSDLGDTIDICAGDGLPDPFTMSTTSMSASNYAYVITSPATEVLGLSTDTTLDLEGAGQGECWVWGISYDGNILIGIGDTVTTFGPLTDACYELSSNYVVVNRTAVDGGTITTQAGDTAVDVCVSDGTPDTIVFSHATTSFANYAYVVTDENNEVLGLPSSNFNDFEGAGVGVCRVWGLSYTGNLQVMIGDNAASDTLSDGCYVLSSNYIEVNRTICSGIEDRKPTVRLSVYPSPASAFIAIEIKGRTRINLENIEIIDSRGKLVYSESNLTIPVKSIDVSSFSPGVYVVRINSEMGTYDRSFVVE